MLDSRPMRSARSCLPLILVMILFWIVVAWIWPNAALYYFAITGGVLGLFVLVIEIRRAIESTRRP